MCHMNSSKRYYHRALVAKSLDNKVVCMLVLN